MENDISGMIAKIIQNPEFADMVKEIRGGDESTDEVQKGSQSAPDWTLKR